jgi:4-hydroxy-3-polyprenylbenzoate decarboxylase
LDSVELIVAVTGASGSMIAREMLKAVEADPRVSRVHFVQSEHSRRVLSDELGIGQSANILEVILGGPANKTIAHVNANIGASIASGSYRTKGMIVLPCSMGTLASIANGIANSLITRAADVTLKERRPLLLCVRETPFNRIHLRNMTLATEAGAVIFPLMPAFYSRPTDTLTMARQFVGRVLAHIGLQQSDTYVWNPED